MRNLQYNESDISNLFGESSTEEAEQRLFDAGLEKSELDDFYNFLDYAQTKLWDSDPTEYMDNIQDMSESELEEDIKKFKKWNK